MFSTPAGACLQRMELEAVKKERTQLMASLAQIKADSGKAGGELQAEDVRRLRKELELKLQKLNELKRVRCRMGWRVTCAPQVLLLRPQGEQLSLDPALPTARQQAGAQQQQVPNFHGLSAAPAAGRLLGNDRAHVGAWGLTSPGR